MPGSELLPLGRSFYQRPTPEVARALLGCHLIREDRAEVRTGLIVETEAYTGSDDPASHAARGPTPRNRVMFDLAGVAYVYFIYGCHHCFNVVAHGPDQAGAVLIRALEPLATGPGRLCKALANDRSHTGWDLTQRGQLWIGHGSLDRPLETACGTRIGIRRATEKLWRFWIDGNRWVSGSPVDRAGRGRVFAVEPAQPRRTGEAWPGPEESN